MSGSKRIFRKLERTPEELAELKAEREWFAKNRPDLEDLLATGEYEGPFRQGDVLRLLEVVSALKRRRQEQGSSLAELAERSGLDLNTITRLERGEILNPSIGTLWQYADAVEARIVLSVKPKTKPAKTSRKTPTRS
jgi:hypothetical protein